MVRHCFPRLREVHDGADWLLSLVCIVTLTGPVGTSIKFHEKSLDEAKKDIDLRKAWFRER